MIYGLVGLKGSGKSTVLKLIKERLGGSAKEVMLAGHLKAVCSRVFQFNREDCEHPIKKEQAFDKPVVLNEDMLRAVGRRFNLKADVITDKIRPHVGKELVSIRNILQYIGTEFLREVDPDIHLKMVSSNPDGDVLVVTDIRFQNELDYFKKNRDFVGISIVRPSLSLNSADLHPSEANIPALQSQTQFTIINDDINTLPGKVSGIVELDYWLP